MAKGLISGPTLPRLQAVALDSKVGASIVVTSTPCTPKTKSAISGSSFEHSNWGFVAVAGGTLAAGSSCGKVKARRRRHVTRATAAAQQGSDAGAQADCRIVALVGVDGSGKSKLCAALLDSAHLGPGEVPSPAQFAQKARLLEMESAENRRNFSCYNHFYSAGASAKCTGPRLVLIDTPGHADRLPLVEQALEVAHVALFVSDAGAEVCASDGGVIAAVQQSNRPTVVFLNGLDRAGAAEGFSVAVKRVEQRLGIRPVPLFAPAPSSGDEPGGHILDVLNGTVCSTLECSAQLHASHSANSLSDEARHAAVKLREEVLETIASADDEFMERYLEQEGEVPLPDIRAALRRAVAGGKVVPLVVGSAKTGLGVDALRDTLQDLVPTLDGKHVLEKRGFASFDGLPESRDAPFFALAFRQFRHDGAVYLELRVLSGTLRPMQPLHIADVGNVSFTPSELLQHALRGELVKVRMAGPGDIVVIRKPSNLGASGDEDFLVCDVNVELSKKCDNETLQGVGSTDQPQCYVHVLELDSLHRKERDNLLAALKELAEEHDGMRLFRSESSGEWRLASQGPLHLDLLRERLTEDYNILQFPVHPAPVEYRVSIKAPVSATGKHAHATRARIRKGIQHGGSMKADASVRVELSPLSRGEGVQIEMDSPQIEGHLLGALKEGLLHGLQTAGPGATPLVDVGVRLLQVSLEPEKDKEKEAAAAREAATDAVRKAVEETPDVALLEPIVSMELDVPNSNADRVIADLEARRGEIFGSQENVDHEQHVYAEVPLREIQDYAERFGQLTEGKGVYKIELSGYRDVSKPELKECILSSELKAATS